MAKYDPWKNKTTFDNFTNNLIVVLKKIETGPMKPQDAGLFLGSYKGYFDELQALIKLREKHEKSNKKSGDDIDDVNNINKLEITIALLKQTLDQIAKMAENHAKVLTNENRVQVNKCNKGLERAHAKMASAKAEKKDNQYPEEYKKRLDIPIKEAKQEIRRLNNMKNEIMNLHNLEIKKIKEVVNVSKSSLGLLRITAQERVLLNVELPHLRRQPVPAQKEPSVSINEESRRKILLETEIDRLKIEVKQLNDQLAQAKTLAQAKAQAPAKAVEAPIKSAAPMTPAKAAVLPPAAVVKPKAVTPPPAKPVPTPISPSIRERTAAFQALSAREQNENSNLGQAGKPMLSDGMKRKTEQLDKLNLFAKKPKPTGLSSKPEDKQKPHHP